MSSRQNILNFPKCFYDSLYFINVISKQPKNLLTNFIEELSLPSYESLPLVIFVLLQFASQYLKISINLLTCLDHLFCVPLIFF